MEEIKSNIDKIFDRFSDSMSTGLPKRLSFDYLCGTPENNVSKKRKLSVETSKPDLNVSEAPSESALIASPWEARRLKADLIEAKSSITHLKQEVDQHYRIRSEMECMYNCKVTSLEKRIENSSSKIKDLEKHLSAVRKRATSSKDEASKIKNQLTSQRQSFEERLHIYKKSVVEAEELVRTTKNDLTNEISNLNRQVSELEQNLKATQDELNQVQVFSETLKEKAQKYDVAEKDLENEQQKLNSALLKIKELQYEIAGHEEWKEFSKTSHARLSHMPNLERELVRLRQESKNLRENLGNKLLLEEQVFDLKTRLAKYEQNEKDWSSMKAQVQTLEQEVKEWRSIAVDHCSPNSPQNPSSLRSQIALILQKDLISANEKNSSQSEKKVLESDMLEAKAQFDIYTKANNDLKKALKHHQNILYRIQKKLVLVAKERDCYKQLLENYEKDLTISGPSSAYTPDSQIRLRLDMLEKTVNGYKEMCSALEQEIQNAKSMPDMSGTNEITNEQYERFKKELETLRIENDRLRRRKDELELEMENRCLRGAFNSDRYKVVHFTSNPADEAHESLRNELEKLQAEIERLKRKNHKLMEDHQEMTTRLNDTNHNVTMDVRELNQLRSQLQSAEAKTHHMKEVYKTASTEFREVCYMLFGYRVDRVGNASYRISSMYAETDTEYLNFRLNHSGVLDMLETEYSAALADMIGTHLDTHNSLPAFMSALTLELFNKTTVVV